MKPSEFCAAMKRACPAWFNVDAVVTSDEMAEVEAVRFELRRFLTEAFSLAKRVRAVIELEDRADAGALETDGGLDLMRAAIDTEEIRELRHVIGYLFDPYSIIREDGLPKLVKEYGDVVPGLAEAVSEVVE